jgi:SAM-dependent methyltransferase
VFRALDSGCHTMLAGLWSSGELQRWMADGSLVATRAVDDPQLLSELAAEHAPYAAFVEHAPISPITYPCEWSVSMLADAAIATLDLQRSMLATGCRLKDASAYNVQFVGGRPVFIDVASIERAERLDTWPALDQFQRMFTLPLLLCRLRHWDLRTYFLPSPQGRSIEEAARLVGWPRLALPACWIDLTLPALLGRWAPPRPSTLVDASSAVAPSSTVAPGSEALRWNLARLRRKVLSLAAGYRPRGDWVDYGARCSYDSIAEGFKRSLVEDILRSTHPRQALDLGCNTGEYSLLAARHADRVIAVDGDHDSIETLYRRLRSSPAINTPANITPLVCDLLAPTPAIGFRNVERPAILQRLKSDCVLALALVHHLLVRGNLPLAMLCDLLRDLTTRDLVVEFVPREDPMFRRLLEGRGELFADLDLDRFRAAFTPDFKVLRETAIPHTIRTLLWLRRKDADHAHA